MLLQSGISMAIDQLPFNHLILILVFFAIILLFVFTNGITLRWGEKELTIGGIRKLLAKKDEDIRVKESLKRFSDEIDHQNEAELYELIEAMESRIENALLNEHCYFTLEKYSALVKKELEKRIRRNNLRERLAEENKEKYVERILRDVEKQYELFQAKVLQAKCGDTYTDFNMIKDSIKKELYWFFDSAKKILIKNMKKKISKYEETRPLLQTEEARKFCCDDCITKNQNYIRNLTGTV